MGRRLRWFWHITKKFLFIGGVLMAAWVARDYYLNSYDAAVEQRAVSVIYPQIQQLTWQGVEQYLKMPGKQTLIYIYRSDSLISRWYFDALNKIAADYTIYGVRPLFISIDNNPADMAKFLASKGSLYFAPYYMTPDEARYIRDVIARAGGDFTEGALPYMGTMDHVLFLRTYPIGTVRTGKIREILNQSITARRR